MTHTHELSTHYDEFLDQKLVVSQPCGFDCETIGSHLFDYQQAIVRWALQRGRAATFLDTGLGKTAVQLEWAYRVHLHTGSPVLVLAPLAVAEQTVREGSKFGISVNHCHTGDELTNGVNISNYEKLHQFNPEGIQGIVIDESSILKGFDGKFRKALNVFSEGIPYRLACTATPAPNDLIELTNHAEFLNIMSGKEIIALFFTQDGNTTHQWRLKGHARKDFYRWLASWAVAMRNPADLGFDGSRHGLPPLRMHEIRIDAPTPEGMLFAVEAQTLSDQRHARRSTLEERVKIAADMINGDPDQWLVWCDLNDESAALAKGIPDAIEVKGSDSPAHKVDALEGFATGRYRVLVSKSSICGFGMNFQICHKQLFVGVNHSFEQFYQAVRRSWRFGQKDPVDVYLIASDADGAITSNLDRKRQSFNSMMDELVKEIRATGLSVGSQLREEMDYMTDIAHGKNWTMYLGDCIERIDEIESESVGLSVFSPPFPGMYAYSNSTRDMGNTDGIDEMVEHFRFLACKDKLYRILMPGRLACVHLTQITSMKSRDGIIGLKDYRGAVIKMFVEEGWAFAGEVTIEKNPQIQATRNKERGLLFKSLATDAAMMRMALADYLIYFRKPGDNPEPIKAGISSKYNKGEGWITEEEWIEWASPIWYRHRKGIPGGIRETDVLNVSAAREAEDERHLCPLQLGVIERAVKLWSNPGDIVFSPFGGIGSEGYKSLQLNRKFIGIELKRSYFEQACRNLASVDDTEAQTLLDLIA